MFDQLTSVKMGDYFYIETAGRHLKYQVTDIRVVLPHETESLNKVEGKDLATLITCTPYGVNTHRLLVTGERVPMDEEAVAAEAAQVKGSVMKPWMIAVLAAVALIIVVSTVLWIVSRKRRKDEPSPVEAPSELSGAEQITQTATMTDDEIDAGRTAALRKMLEERGKE